MKKLTIVLTLALVLALAMPVFANPFSDVPADHWAYEAIAKLQADNVIQGNPDGSFTGSKTITRYEMAMIVAKAIAAAEKNADKITKEDEATISKLSAEFSSELAALNVRVTALEKKAGNVKITGDARVRTMGDEVKVNDVKSTYEVMGNSGQKTDLRIRLNATATINDKFTAFARLRVNNVMINDSTSTNPDVNTDNFYIQYADKGVTATAGRVDLVLGKGTIIDDTIKGLIVSVPTGNFTTTALYGYLDQDQVLNNGTTALTAIELSGIKVAKNLNLGLDYGVVKFKDVQALDDVKVGGVNFDYAINDKVSLFGEYVKSDMKLATDKDGNKDKNQNAYLIGVKANNIAKNTNLKVSYAELGLNSVVPGLYTKDDVYKNAIAAAGIGAGAVQSKNVDKVKLWNVKLDYALAANTNLYIDYTDAKTNKVNNNEGKATEIETGLEFKF